MLKEMVREYVLKRKKIIVLRIRKVLQVVGIMTTDYKENLVSCSSTSRIPCSIWCLSSFPS
jgi:hypothetical protein